MNHLSCRNCGYAVAEEKAAIEAASSEYHFDEADYQSGRHSIHVWCLDCAVADGRVDDPSELEGIETPFWWELKF